MNTSYLKKAKQLLFIFSLTSISVSATETDKHELKSLLPSDCIFSGDFIQSKTIKALPQPLLSSGKLFFSCKQGLIWHNETPFAESLIYTRDALHFRSLPDNDPEALHGQQHHYLAKFLISLLSADTEQIEKDFVVELNKKDNSSGATLIPSNEIIKKGLKSINLEKKVENEKEMLSITIDNANEQSIALAITNLSTYLNPYPDNKENPCETALSTTLPTTNACDILSTPQHYQTTDGN